MNTYEFVDIEFIDSSSLVTHPRKSSKTIVALLRQGQKAVALLHLPILQTTELLSGQQKRDPGTPPVSGQYPRNPLISSLFMCLYPSCLDRRQTVSTCPVWQKLSTGVTFCKAYFFSHSILRSLARVALSQLT